MFVSRGYRGMHIFPYPSHIVDQINQGLLTHGLKDRVESQLVNLDDLNDSTEMFFSNRVDSRHRGFSEYAMKNIHSTAPRKETLVD